MSAQNMKHTNTPSRSEGGGGGRQRRDLLCRSAENIIQFTPNQISACVCLLPYIWMCVKAPDQVRCLHALI